MKSPLQEYEELKREQNSDGLIVWMKKNVDIFPRNELPVLLCSIKDKGTSIRLLEILQKKGIIFSIKEYCEIFKLFVLGRGKLDSYTYQTRNFSINYESLFKDFILDYEKMSNDEISLVKRTYQIRNWMFVYSDNVEILNSLNKVTLKSLLIIHSDGLGAKYVNNFIKSLDIRRYKFTDGEFNKITSNSTIKRLYKLKVWMNCFTDFEKVDANDIETEILKCKTIGKINDIIMKTKYKVDGKLIILACQQKINVKMIIDLMGLKINLNEEDVNKIIMNCRDDAKLNDILTAIQTYGYTFTQKNYKEILCCKYYYTLDNVIYNDLVIDESVVDMIINVNEFYHYIDYSFSTRNLSLFLEKIEFLFKKDQKTAENIMALHFFVSTITEIKKIKKQYNINLTSKCLEIYVKVKKNFKKDAILELIFKDGVKTDANVLKTFIEDNCMSKRAYNLLKSI